MSDYQVYAAAIDAYLDGRLTPGQRAELERRAARDPRLAAELELQKRIDERLHTLMTVPAAPALTERKAGGGGIAGRIRAVPVWVRVAAVLALVAAGVWAAVAGPWGSVFGTRPSDQAVNTYYQKVVQTGFKPIWPCDTDAKFKAYTKEKFGMSFLVKGPSNVQVLGWNYTGGLLADTAQVLLFKVNDQPAIVVMGPRSEDRTMRVDAAAPPGYHLHRGVYKGIVMYEFSPVEQPAVLPRVVAP